MKTLYLKALSCLCVFFAMAILFTGCGGGGGGGGVPAGSSTGKVTVSLTDAPTTSLDHVWVTVKEIRFHRSDLCDDPNDGGWLRYPLVTPATLDLASLNNGIWSTLWNGIVLPVGNYQQIRVILAGTEDPLLPSARAKGLLYNNQVDDNGACPLIIPAAKNGIKLIGSFQVTEAIPVHIVVDFDVTHDVVETGSGKYILKPRLKYFIVTIPQTSAIVGTLLRPDGTAFANYTGVNVVIKAEAPETITFANTSSVRVMGIKRSTTVRPDGTFILYPLPASPGNTYDLVVRGADVRTMILRDVPAEPGTTKYATSMFTIELRNGRDYLASTQVVNAETSPYEPALGSSVGFYQTLPGLGEIPYLIRSRDVNPFYGTFGNFPLAYGRLLVGTYNPKALIQSFTGVDPLEGPDTYAAFATAPFFWPSGPKFYSPVITFNRFLLTPQTMVTPPDCDMDDDHESDSHPDKGYYVVCGGLIVDHISRLDLEKGGYEFQSVDANGKDLKSHGKNDTVKMNNRKPIKIKFNKSKK
jgi:hypothetical protein